MKITQKEAKEICELYNLGKLISFEEIPKGLVNQIFDIKTEKGNFIARFINRKMDKWKRDKLELEFNVMEHLKNEKFPYKIPFPLENNKKEKVSSINKKEFWVYKKIEGELDNKKDHNKKIKEAAIALAKYHKAVKDFKWKKEELNGEHLKREYSQLMSKIEENKTFTKFEKEGIIYFDSLIDKIPKKGTNFIPVHRDFHWGNFIFKKNKIVGILDFDNIQFLPRIVDVARFISLTCFKFDDGLKPHKERLKILFKEYEKILPLSKREKDQIISFIIYENLNAFLWLLTKMKKQEEEKKRFLEYSLNTTKSLLKEFPDRKIPY